MDMLDIYTDYLICQNKHATATGLSDMVDGEFSHDKVTRFLRLNSFEGVRKVPAFGSLSGELFKKSSSFCRQYSILCRMIKLDHIEMQKIT